MYKDVCAKIPMKENPLVDTLQASYYRFSSFSCISAPFSFARNSSSFASYRATTSARLRRMSAISLSNTANAGSPASSTVSSIGNPELFTLGVLPADVPNFPNEFELVDGKGWWLPLILLPRDDMDDREFFRDSVIGWETNGCEFGLAGS